MSSATYLKFELLRSVRNKRVFIFSLGFPLVFYFIIAAPQRHDHNFGSTTSVPHTGLFAPQYYMVGLLAFGTMVAAMSGGAGIAADRSVGWNRQLRLTPLSPRGYFRAKLSTSFALTFAAVILLYIAGTSLGVRLDASQWVRMTVLALIALIPFAALGIALGHLLTVDAMGPAMGGGTSIFAFLGGTWFPLTGGGGFVAFCKLLPSFWLVQAGHVGLPGQHDDNPWGAEGWIVIAAWSVAMTAFAIWAYRRDTQRV
jgi:ABC-2 type transport system permease protein